MVTALDKMIEQMNNNLNWYEFEAFAQELLLQGQIVDANKQYIQLVVEASFDNNVNFRLEINEDAVKWYRTTWLKPADMLKFHNPIESLKYIGQEIKPTINYQKGEIAIQKIANIIDLAKSVSIKPLPEEQNFIVLDGINYTLTICIGELKTTYKWNYLEDDRQDLKRLTSILEEFNVE